jgi:hypothetical protein
VLLAYALLVGFIAMTQGAAASIFLIAFECFVVFRDLCNSVALVIAPKRLRMRRAAKPPKALPPVAP